MNEDTQLKAMAAELRAAGYQVRQDIPGHQLEIDGVALPGLSDTMLDLVAVLNDKDGAEHERPRLLVIEVANRKRRVSLRGSAASALPRHVEDDLAMQRFDAISEALAIRSDAELEIRFLDVSADQASARALKNPLRAKDSMQKRILDDVGLLTRSVGRDRLSRALVIARLWAHWLRIIGHLYPGREHRELPYADLRTIQKEIYDQKLIETPPGSYLGIHQSLLAAFEGGDFNIKDLLALETDVRALLKWAGENFGISQPEESPASGTLYERLIREIDDRLEGQRRDELRSAITAVWITQGLDVFPKMVLDFLIALGREPLISDELVTELLETAGDTSN